MFANVFAELLPIQQVLAETGDCMLPISYYEAIAVLIGSASGVCRRRWAPTTVDVTSQ